MHAQVNLDIVQNTKSNTPTTAETYGHTVKYPQSASPQPEETRTQNQGIKPAPFLYRRCK